MPGFSSITGQESVMFADNASFDGTKRGGVITTDGQFWIGNSVSPRVRVGTLTSPLGTITIGYAAPNITIDLAGGSMGIDSINVDASTPPGTDPVVPDGGGQITITGGQVAAGVIGANVIRTDSLAANTFTIEIQRSAAVGATDSANNGVAHFNSAFFTVDANGFVSASGTGLGQTITGNTGGALPPTAGNWNILGTSTNGIQSAGAGSTLTVRMQSPYADDDFTFQSTVSGATRTLMVENTNNTANSTAIFQARVGGTTAAAAFLRTALGATKSYAIGQSGSQTWLDITTEASGSAAPNAGTLVQRFDEGIVGAFRVWFPITNAALGGSALTSGATVDWNINNTQAAANSDARVNLQVTGAGSGGNAYITYTGPADNWFHGVNKTAGSSAWQLQTIVVGGFPTANLVMSATTAGEVTFPLTPAFLATHATAQNNVTGAGATVTVINDNEIFDQNGDYNPATGVFTAPVTGRYMFASAVRFEDASTSTAAAVVITTSNRSYIGNNSAWGLSVGLSIYGLTVSSLTDMDAGDTAQIDAQVVGMAGNTADISNNQSGTYFSGFLQC